VLAQIKVPWNGVLHQGTESSTQTFFFFFYPSPRRGRGRGRGRGGRGRGRRTRVVLHSCKDERLLPLALNREVEREVGEGEEGEAVVEARGIEGREGRGKNFRIVAPVTRDFLLFFFFSSSPSSFADGF
jgi:hypothetical protein